MPVRRLVLPHSCFPLASLLPGRAESPEPKPLVAAMRPSRCSSLPSRDAALWHPSQAAIGASRAAGFDLTAACSGFVMGLVTGAQYIRAGSYKTVLVIGEPRAGQCSSCAGGNCQWLSRLARAVGHLPAVEQVLSGRGPLLPLLVMLQTVPF